MKSFKKRDVSALKKTEHYSVIFKYADILTGIASLIALFILISEQIEFFRPFQLLFKKINSGILIFFLFDIVSRVFLVPDKLLYIKRKWMELITAVLIVKIIAGIDSYSAYMMILLFVVIYILISRMYKVTSFVSKAGLRPAHLMIALYFLFICAGAVILSLPVSLSPGKSLSLIDAFFTATSALTITGLAVQDTATVFSRFGQVVIMLLIQIGGLGIMTFSVFLFVISGRKLGMSQRIVMHDVLDREELSGAVRTIRFIFNMTFILELSGAAALAFIWYPLSGSIGESLFHGLFHSVSAFCNAGFSTFSTGLTGFASDIGINAVICFLIISGSLGFMAVHDIFDRIKGRFSRGMYRARPRLRIQTVIILIVTAVVTVIGSLLIFIFETGGAAFGSDPLSCVIKSIFQAVTVRSAGFNSCEVSLLSPVTLFLLMIMMFIGGSPGSTGGGLKTTTVAVLWKTMTNGFGQNRNVEILKRTIPHETIQKATTLLIFYIIMLSVFIMALLYTERLPVIDILFEAVSAGATVGISTGITPKLSEPGRILIMILMFTGRLGLLTIGYALAFNQRKAEYTYAEERVMIG